MDLVRPAFTLLVAALLAGCASDPVTDDPASSDQGQTGADDGGRMTGGAATSGVRVLDHKDSYYLNHPMTATTMAVPANVSSLRAQLTTSSVGPCGAVVGEPEDPLGPRVVFTSPSGVDTVLDATAKQCRVSVLSEPPTVAMLDFAAEPGDWDVTFYGRSLGVEIHLLVDGS